MPRTMLTDIRWELLLQVMKSTGRIYVVVYRMRTGNLFTICFGQS